MTISFEPVSDIRMFPDGRMDGKNAAAYLGLSIKSLAIMRSLGTGPAFFKLGGRCFYRRADLDSWVESRRVTSTAQYRARRAATA
ncbi:MAG TPA: helix-turn-helix domain-containing protein [Candidatus Competibacteraceae bacterium]|nr:helix-turn-helix domain-containing protein [Candidatus Competibacteraceae bacterium]HSA47750.1 helix-turn-helix domain-containing protein [Candidatus Competibacteraceae bacterium]